MPELTELAFGEFYRRHARAVWSYVYRVTGNAADADDIVQDAFCRILRADVSDLNEEDTRKYLFRVAGNLITDRWRRAKREISWLARLRQPLAQAPSDHDEWLARTFAKLKARERALLWLAYVEQQNHQEIAESLGLSRGSVKVLLSRARGRLRNLLKASRIIARA
ncbi:MAG TPA: sigma-70 family RNA polymerase sigma factor [Vicinamibacterales bacterium]|jgi:RNA polymerase sigma-70 factor (ECF subfamily)